MLSVCIPVYNYEITPLVRTLLPQLSSCCGDDFEILLADDCSRKEIQEKNRNNCPVDPRLHWLEPGCKLGRAAIRNYLGRAAVHPWILFMDCDVIIDNQSFVANYLKRLDKADVIVGGCTYEEIQPPVEQLLRWTYGRTRETRSAAVRNQTPHQAFSSFNFCICKEALEACPFDESFNDYGHEDTLFGLGLKQAGFSVLHIDNPLVHIGLETNHNYLANSLTAVEKFLRMPVFKEPQTITAIKILRWYYRLKSWGFRPFLAWLYKTAGPAMLRQLCGNKPSIRIFDLYRLSYLCSLKGAADTQQQTETSNNPANLSRPFFSIVIPYFNRESTLPDCLSSIEQQTFRPFELILVDDGSTDGSQDLCRKFQSEKQTDDFQIRLISSTGEGACQARNEGLKAAKAPWLICFDSDDRMLPGYLSYFHRLIAAPEAPDMAVCRFKNDQGAVLPKHLVFSPAQQLIDPVLMTHNVCISASLLSKSGLWNTSLQRWQDLEFGFRLLLTNSKLRYTKEILYCVSTSPDAISAASYTRDFDKLQLTMKALREDIGRISEPALREQLMSAWCFKQVSLAALLWQEKSLELSDGLYKQALASLPEGRKKDRLLLACHYAYTKRGGRGFWRIAYRRYA